MRALRMLYRPLVLIFLAQLVPPRQAAGAPRGDPWKDPWARAERRKSLALDSGPASPTKDSEAAVDAALAWLARSQERAGNWLVQRWDGSITDEEGTVGVTGLATLAFLGAGHSEKAGEHAAAVLRAVGYLMSRQGRDGAIKSGYSHAIAGLALAEAYGLARVPATGAAAQKAAGHSVRVHQGPDGGWRYSPKQPGDMSVTGWFVQQLKAAKDAGLRVDARAFQGAARFLQTCTVSRGREPGTARYQPDRDPSTGMTAAGLVCRGILWPRRRDSLALGASNHLLAHLPDWKGARGWAFYYWYYGTAGMFRTGGARWRLWSAAMRDTLVQNQRDEPDRDERGSWDPVHDGQRGGRVYTTALAALCLEVYYRRPPPDGRPPGKGR